MRRGEALEACRAFFLARLCDQPLRRAGALRWCDDTPDSWLYLDFLHELYPAMRFIHMIRDPRDVVGSYMKQTWAPADPKVIVTTFKAQFAAYEAVKARVPAQCIKEIRLEDIATDKAAVLDDLSAFLNVDNRFDCSIFAAEKAGSGSYADKLGSDVMGLITKEHWPTGSPRLGGSSPGVPSGRTHSSPKYWRRCCHIGAGQVVERRLR